MTRFRTFVTLAVLIAACTPNHQPSESEQPTIEQMVARQRVAADSATAAIERAIGYARICIDENAALRAKGTGSASEIAEAVFADCSDQFTRIDQLAIVFGATSIPRQSPAATREFTDGIHATARQRIIRVVLDARNGRP